MQFAYGLSVTRCAKVQETYAVRLLVSLIAIDAILEDRRCGDRAGEPIVEILAGERKTEVAAFLSCFRRAGYAEVSVQEH